MKSFLPVVVLASVALWACSPNQMRHDLVQLPPPAAAQNYAPRLPEQWKLDNGLTVMLLQDKELPVVQGALYFKGGALWENVSRPGVAAAMGDQMRQGGAGDLSAEALDLELERLSASISSTVGAEFGKVGFYALSADLRRVFSLFTDVVMRPRFEETRLSVWKGRLLEAIRRRKDEPHVIAALSLTELLYGDSMYGRVLTEGQVGRISREDLLAAHAEFVQPAGAILLFCGNIDRAEASRLAEQYFGTWKGKERAYIPPPVGEEAMPAIYFVRGPFEQATVVLGQLGVPRLTPDYAAIEGFNELFSGSFTSRLFARIRTELGLAYSVSGAIQPGVVKGMNLVGLQTKTGNAAQAISEVFRVMERLQSEPPGEVELGEVKRSIENSFIFKFASSEKVIDRAALLQILNYPQDYDARHLERVRAITPTDILQVARSRWDLSKIVVVVVGDENAYTSLASLKDDSSEVLRKMSIRNVSFDEELRLNQ